MVIFAKFRLVGVQCVRQRRIHATDSAHYWEVGSDSKLIQYGVLRTPYTLLQYYLLDYGGALFATAALFLQGLPPKGGKGCNSQPSQGRGTVLIGFARGCLDILSNWKHCQPRVPPIQQRTGSPWVQPVGNLLHLSSKISCQIPSRRNERRTRKVPKPISPLPPLPSRPLLPPLPAQYFVPHVVLNAQPPPRCQPFYWVK